MILQPGDPAPDIDFVTKRIAVGAGIYSVEQVRALENVGITHVLDCRTSNSFPEIYQGSPIWWVHHPVADDGKPRPTTWYQYGLSYAYRWLNDNKQARLLVHCTAGYNRSPSLVYAILRAQGLYPAQAESMIKEARSRATDRYFEDAERALAELGYL